MKDFRTKKITVRYTEDELVKAKENSEGVFAVWLRELSLNQKSKKGRNIKLADPDLLYELNKLGTNLNQITRRLNSDDIDTVKLLMAIGSMNEELIKIREHYVS